MARAHLKHIVREDSSSRVIQNAAVYVYQDGTTTGVGGMWSAPSGGSALSNPLISNAQGEVEAWLDVAQRVDLKVTDNSDTAKYAGTAQLLSFADFTEDYDVYPHPDDMLGRTESLNTVAASGSTETLPAPTTATVHDVTLTANCTFTFPTVGAGGHSFTLILRQDATGGRTATWPASVRWPGATAPALSTGANQVDVLSFLTVDSGTTWFGFIGGYNFA
jgi:hypothetical protein